MALSTLLLLPLLLACLNLAQGQRYDDLFSKLMDEYKSRGSQYTIPLMSDGDVVHVNVSMTLIEIKSLDPKTGDAVLDAWMGYYWRDGRLRWKPAKHDGIKQLHIPPSFIWKPDIVLYNGYVIKEEYDAILEHDGSIIFIPKSTIKTRCNITSNGKATCALKFGSWTYNGNMISPRITGGSAILSDYVKGSYLGWDVVKAHAKRNVKHYPCCPEPYPDVTFTLVFKQTVSGWLDYF